MKAKKLILGALLVVFGTSAQAQIVSSQSNRVVVTEQGKTVEPMKPRDYKWYLKAGVSQDKLAGFEKLTDSSVGYDVSFGFIKPTQKENLFWGAEFGLMSIGGKKVTFKSDNINDFKKQTAISLSAYVGYDIASIESVRISPYIGPYLSYTLTKCEENSGSNASGTPIYWVSNENTKFSGGVNVGVGFWISDNFSVDIHFRRALLKNIEGYRYSRDYDGYSQKIVLGLGLAF